MRVILRKLFWFLMFLVSTFCFYVLFEHGFEQFPDNARKEVKNLQTIYEEQIEKDKKESATP